MTAVLRAGALCRDALELHNTPRCQFEKFDGIEEFPGITPHLFVSLSSSPPLLYEAQQVTFKYFESVLIPNSRLDGSKPSELTLTGCAAHAGEQCGHAQPPAACRQCLGSARAGEKGDEGAGACVKPHSAMSPAILPCYCSHHFLAIGLETHGMARQCSATGCTVLQLR